MFSRLYQIHEEDLAELERTLPQLVDALVPMLENPLLAGKLRTQIRRLQTILSNVRWNYGPPSEVESVDPD